MPCQTCEKLRGLVVGAWQRMTSRHCIVRGCSGTYPICRRHWNSLPVPLRQRWWQETDYAGRTPNAALVAEINRAIEQKRISQ